MIECHKLAKTGNICRRRKGHKGDCYNPYVELPPGFVEQLQCLTGKPIDPSDWEAEEV